MLNNQRSTPEPEQKITDDSKDQTSQGLADEVTKLTDDLNNLTKQSEEYLKGWKRAQADYQNLKKETANKNQELANFIQATLLLDILPIINHLKVALTHLSANQKEEVWVKGIAHIYRQFADWLKKQGIEEIKTINEKFDPEFHEAIGQETNKELADHVILSEVSPGYKLDNKVITPAKVIVNIKNN